MKLKPLLALGLACGLGLPMAAAPLGTAFQYQGFLATNGVPVTGTYGLQFRLFEDPAGTTQLGEVTLDNVTVVDGLFTVSLDFGGDAFTGPARWLRIGIRPGGSMEPFSPLAGSDELKPGPYALYAATAPWDGLAGIPAGFADGTDDDTTYTAGSGLTYAAGEFQVDFAGSGAAVTVARSDHDHGALYAPLIHLHALAALSGTLQDAQLAGTYSGTLNFSNPGNSFAGDGSAMVGLNAETLDGHDSAEFWKIAGNEATSPLTDFVGTKDNQPLEFRVKDRRALRLEPGSEFPNLIGGSASNSIAAEVSGATIGGGADNRVGIGANYATIPGGIGNEVNAPYAVAMGRGARANHPGAFVWGDSHPMAIVASTAPDQFTVRAGNGVRLTTDAGQNKPIQVGERYRDNALIAWAKVSGIGDVESGFGGVSANRKSKGLYELTLTATVLDHFHLIPLANPVLPSQPTNAAMVRIVAVHQATPVLFNVYINNGSGDPEDSAFVFMVTGR